jgi:hypothetical protein
MAVVCNVRQEFSINPLPVRTCRVLHQALLGSLLGCQSSARGFENRSASDVPWRAGALPVMTRPKGMWRSTFDQLQERAVAADIVADLHWESNLMKIARRVNRRLRPKLQTTNRSIGLLLEPTR